MMRREDAEKYIAEMGVMRKEYLDHEMAAQKAREVMKEKMAKVDLEFIKKMAKDEVMATSDGEEIEMRASRIRALFLKKERLLFNKKEAEILKLFILVFKNLARETFVIFDPKVHKLKGTYKLGSIVIGAYGFGIRENVNAHSITTMDEVRYIYAHRDQVMKSLKEQGCDVICAKFHAFCNAIPNIQVFDERLLRAEVRKEITVFGANMVLGKARAMKFSYGSTIRYSLETEDVTGAWSEQVIVEGKMITSMARRVALYEVMRPYIDGLLDQLEEEVIALQENFKITEEEDWMDKVRLNFGKTLLLSGV